MNSNIVQFPGIERTPILSVRETEKTKSDPVAMAFVCESQFLRLFGSGRLAHVVRLARLGNVSIEGKIHLRLRARGKPVQPDGWMFHLHQIESGVRDCEFAFALEIGDRQKLRPQIATLLLQPGFSGYKRAMICPKCCKRSDSWYLYCASGYGWACTVDCLAMDLKQTLNASAVFSSRLIDRRLGDVQFQPSFRIRRICKTAFMEKHPRLLETLPAVFNVRMDEEKYPIGWFVADPRQLPIIESSSVAFS